MTVPEELFPGAVLFGVVRLANMRRADYGGRDADDGFRHGNRSHIVPRKTARDYTPGVVLS